MKITIAGNKPAIPKNVQPEALCCYEMEICLAGFGLASSFLGIEILRMPFSYFAPIFSPSAEFGRVNERLNDW